MRYILFYTKKTIKYLFALLTILCIVIMPFFLMNNSVNGTDGGSDFIDSLREEPSIVPIVSSSPNEEFGDDFYLTFDEEAFNGFEPTDYLLILNQSDTSNPVVDQTNPLYWTPNYEDITEVESSISYSVLKDNPIDGFDDTAEGEAAKQEAIKNHILTHDNEFTNDGSEPFATVPDMQVWTVNAWVRFEETIETPDGTMQTQTREVNTLEAPIKLNNNSSSSDSKTAKEAINVTAPSIDFANVSSTGSLAKTRNEFSKFIQGETLLTVGNLTNQFAPRVYFNVGSQGITYYEAFKVPPTVDLKVYISDDTESFAYNPDDILVFEGTQSMDSEYERLKNVLVFDPQLISDWEGAYNESNELSRKETIKIDATLSYEYKTEEEILAEYPELEITFNLGEGQTNHFGETFNKSLTNDKDNLATTADQDVFFDVAEFNKSSMPNLIVYPNWDENGKFNLLVGTQDKYIFESDYYGPDDMEMYLFFNVINERTGVETDEMIKLREFEYTDDYYDEYGRVFYSRIYTTSILSEDESYYFANTTHVDEYGMYSGMNTQWTYSTDESNLDGEYGSARQLQYSDINFVYPEDLTYDVEEENTMTIILSDNFHEITSHKDPSYFTFSVVTFAFLAIFVLLPLIIWLFIILGKRIKN